MKIRVITASAGSGKTTRLSEVLDGAVASGQVRPDRIIATTFTRQAAAELIERARSHLLAHGRSREAHQLLAARIGTVHSVCGSLIEDFAFELGLSPSLRVLDEPAAELEQKHALASVVTAARADELHQLQRAFSKQLDWRYEVRRLLEAARANALTPTDLAGSAQRSMDTLDACLGPCEANGSAIGQALLDAIDNALRSIDTSVDTKKSTRKYLALLDHVRRNLVENRRHWGDWAKLCIEEPATKSRAAAAPIAAAAKRHIAHPQLRDDMHRFTQLLFEVAADGLTAYQAHKRERGLLDFVDQEAFALQLLRRRDVREALEGQLDLVLIDEFQDTSPLQLAIFLELASLARESVWVGDQKQAIYGFRGTDPALMDAVIESMTSTTHDPALIAATLDTVGATSTFETLSTSYRSRPALVDLTNELFAKAFARHGLPEERTRLTPALAVEPPDLGPLVEYWPLLHPDRANKEVLAGAAAAGVRDLLSGGPSVRERHTTTTRLAGPRDVAVLCRTNAQCQHIAEALGQLGIPAVVPRMRLLDTAEGQLVTAALRLWVDPRDSLAAAVLARLVTYATDLEGLVNSALAPPGKEAFARDPLVAAILAARAATPDLDPVTAVATVIDAASLRELCAAWGNSAQRQANLDALRAHAVTYAAEALARRGAPSVVGLLAHLDAMTDEWDWKSPRNDRQALLGGTDAVTVSTWHAAKGREWPITILYGLESLHPPAAFGLHVETTAAHFTLDAPLAGRWLRYWPNPYSTANQGGPIKEACEASVEFAAIADRRQREALRLLYVGWTRARDRLVLAAAGGKLLGGLLGTLTDLDPSLISEPPNTPGDFNATWAGHPVTVHVRPVSAAPAAMPPPQPGEVTLGRSPQTYAPARQSPSSAPQVPCTLGTPISIGPRLHLRGQPDMDAIGEAVHGFLAADRPTLPDATRLAMALGLLERYGVDAHLDAAELVAAATRLCTWTDTHLSATRLHREWPVAHRLASGTLVTGTVDLVVRSSTGLAIIDHKSFPGSQAAALTRIPKHSGQLAAYASAVSTATGVSVTSTWIHLPLLGTAVEVLFP